MTLTLFCSVLQSLLHKRSYESNSGFCSCFRAAVCCIGGMYEKLGRMVGRSYEETVQLLIKALRNAEVSNIFIQYLHGIYGN